MPHTNLEGELTATGLRIALIVARFNDYLTFHMRDAAINTFARMGGKADDEASLTVAYVPGSFELPVTALNLAKTGKYDAIICLGCVIRGETDHYDHVVEQTAKGIKDVGVITGLPCIFGVLTCDTLEQAISRAGSKMGNAGRSAMMTGIEMANLMKKVK